MSSAENSEKKSIAVYPGSFDPITLGHLNIIKRAAAVFDKIIVCIMVNSAKNPMFTVEERYDMVKRVVARFPNVEVDVSDKLLVEYTESRGATIILRGLRALSDFEMEFQMAMANKIVNPKIEMVYLMASGKYTYLSSSVVKEMAKYNADLSEFAPREIIKDIIDKSNENRR